MFSPFGHDNPFSSAYSGRARRPGPAPASSRRRAEEEERARRRELEGEAVRRQELEARRRGRLGRSSVKQAAASLPPGTIVRGRDGRLYEVVPPRQEGIRGAEGQSPYAHDASTSGSRGGREERRMPRSSNRSGSITKTHEREAAASSNQRMPPLDRAEHVHAANRGKRSANATPVARISPPIIVVEDVPDEEDAELRELRSARRNRTPSDGAWMEPVESFRSQ